jgi:hypothetical protein
MSRCTGPSCARRARSLKNCGDVFVAGEIALVHVGKTALDGPTLFIRQPIDTGAAFLDLARDFGELLLILFRPAQHAIDDFFHLFPRHLFTLAHFERPRVNPMQVCVAPGDYRP